MNPNFWKNKKVLITGHTGLKGSWLTMWLKIIGAEVTGYALEPPTKLGLYKLANVEHGITSIIGNIRDLENVKSLVLNHSPEIVIHLAARSLSDYSINNPIDTMMTNTMGTANLLEAVRHSRCTKVVVLITSDKCYASSPNEELWGYREDAPLGGMDPYSCSKAGAEMVVSAYRNSYFMANSSSSRKVALATSRVGNVIGGGDWASNRLLPDLVKAFMGNEKALVRNPTSLRPWQHVLEPLNGCLILAEKLWKNGDNPSFSQPWNFGPGEDEVKPVSWIADRMANLWGNGARWEEVASGSAMAKGCLRLTSSKARFGLGWNTKLTLPNALEWIVEWYKEYQKNKDVGDITRKQIVKFQSISQ